MTVLSAIQDACKVIGVTGSTGNAVPDSIASSTERERVELLALANEMADRIAKAHDWQKFATIATITGDGATEAFDLPSDYDRQRINTQLWSSSLEAPLSHIADLNQWLGLDVQSFDFVVNAWTIYGGQIQIKPALATGVTAKYFYQSNLIVEPESGSNKATFTLDEDTFRLSEELLKLGIIWQWRANKGLPYAEDMQNYEIELAKQIMRDKGARRIVMGTNRTPRDVRVAYPQNIPVS